MAIPIYFGSKIKLIHHNKNKAKTAIVYKC